MYNQEEDKQLLEVETERRRVFQGPIFSIDVCKATLPNGKTARRDVMMHSGGVCILPIHDDGTVTLVRQYRYGASMLLWEAPAGKLEPGEDSLHSAIRELSEETGFTAQEVIPMGKMHSSPAIMSEIIYLYAATGLTAGESHPDDDEFLQRTRIPFEKALQMVDDGEITDGKTQLLLLKWKRRVK